MLAQVLGMGFMHLALVWPTHHLCGYLGNEPEDGRSFCFSTSLCVTLPFILNTFSHKKLLLLNHFLPTEWQFQIQSDHHIQDFHIYGLKHPDQKYSGKKIMHFE